VVDQLADRVAAALRRRWDEPVEVTEPRRLAGGASREIWAVTARAGGRERRLVLRRAAVAAQGRADLELEAAALAAAGKAEVPVPAVHGLVPDVGLLMDHVEGESIPRRLLRDDRWSAARSVLAGQLGRALARIHSIPPAELPALVGGDALESLRAEHDAYGEPRPALEVAFRWLTEHRPPPAPAVVLHGDFRNGNLMVGPDGLRAVLDWELVHLGDPAQDLGWLCAKPWRFGADAPVGGFGSRAELLAGYAEVAGWAPDEATLRWWELFGTARWAVICRRQAQRHLDGSEPSVELAVIGRRICESEYDLLRELGLAGPSPVTDPLTAAGRPDPSSVHDRPGVDELLAAAAGFLSADLADLEPRLRFHARVAANAVAIARRELLLGPAQRAAHQARLARLECTDDAALVAAIRSGSLDDRWDEVLAAVRASTIDKLAVANPRYLA
jgi:aminoglycoside phosphotransferase (APT) family kinase protein